MDIFVGNDGKNEIYFSAGDGSGAFAAAPADCAATAGSSDTRSAAIADLDGDGFADLYVGNFAEISTYQQASTQNTELFVGDGLGGFEQRVGSAATPAMFAGLAVVIDDLNVRTAQPTTLVS